MPNSSFPSKTQFSYSSSLKMVAVYLGLGLEWVVVIVAFLWAGKKIDERLATEPLFLLVGLCLGFVVCGWQMYRLINKNKL